MNFSLFFIIILFLSFITFNKAGLLLYRHIDKPIKDILKTYATLIKMMSPCEALKRNFNRTKENSEILDKCENVYSNEFISSLDSVCEASLIEIPEIIFYEMQKKSIFDPIVIATAIVDGGADIDDEIFKTVKKLDKKIENHKIFSLMVNSVMTSAISATQQLATSIQNHSTIPYDFLKAMNITESFSDKAGIKFKISEKFYFQKCTLKKKQDKYEILIKFHTISDLQQYQLLKAVFFRTVIDTVSPNCVIEYIGPEYVILNKMNSEIATIDSKKVKGHEIILFDSPTFEVYDQQTIEKFTTYNCSFKSASDTINYREFLKVETTRDLSYIYCYGGSIRYENKVEEKCANELIVTGKSFQILYDGEKVLQIDNKEFSERVLDGGLSKHINELAAIINSERDADFFRKLALVGAATTIIYCTLLFTLRRYGFSIAFQCFGFGLPYLLGYFFNRNKKRNDQEQNEDQNEDQNQPLKSLKQQLLIQLSQTFEQQQAIDQAVKHVQQPNQLLKKNVFNL